MRRSRADTIAAHRGALERRACVPDSCLEPCGDTNEIGAEQIAARRESGSCGR